MRYLGGKQRLGKTIADRINLIAELEGLTTYCEPFCGMCGVARHVEIRDKRLSDIHPDLILFLQELANGWQPPTSLSREEYQQLRHAQPSHLRAFAGFCCSFAGKWFAGYASPSASRDYASEASRSSVKLIEDLTCWGVVSFANRPYWDSPETQVTYCDPPYAGTTSYASAGRFDSDRFWEWVRRRQGHVFVSEYRAPEWAKCVWQKRVKSTIDRAASSGSAKNDRVERLFYVANC